MPAATFLLPRRTAPRAHEKNCPCAKAHIAVNERHASSTIAQRRSDGDAVDGNQLFQGEGLGIRKTPAASRKPNSLKIVMDKFPSVEVLSRYTDPLLPTCCQHRQAATCEKRPEKRTAMRRADRLFQIIQVLRRTRKPLTADAIAAELETSKRTIYRDIATLIEQRVPIRGEAGMGYILEKGFDLPPLMLTPDEIEAAVLGAQWVAGHADPVLARAAAGPDGEDRRHGAGTLAALRARTRKPRAAGLEPGARPHRHGADARPDPRGQEDHAELPRRAWPRQRAHDLADRHRLSRGGADHGGLVRAAQGFPQLSHRPRRRCGLPRRKISGAARLLRAKWRRSLVWEAPKETREAADTRLAGRVIPR